MRHVIAEEWYVYRMLIYAFLQPGHQEAIIPGVRKASCYTQAHTGLTCITVNTDDG